MNFKAAKLKAVMLPVTGALLGGIVGGPVGLMVGMKVGAAAALVGGASGKMVVSSLLIIKFLADFKLAFTSTPLQSPDAC